MCFFRKTLGARAPSESRRSMPKRPAWTDLSVCLSVASVDVGVSRTTMLLLAGCAIGSAIATGLRVW